MFPCSHFLMNIKTTLTEYSGMLSHLSHFKEWLREKWFLFGHVYTAVMRFNCCTHSWFWRVSSWRHGGAGLPQRGFNGSDNRAALGVMARSVVGSPFWGLGVHDHRWGLHFCHLVALYMKNKETQRSETSRETSNRVTLQNAPDLQRRSCNLRAEKKNCRLILYIKLFEYYDDTDSWKLKLKLWRRTRTCRSPSRTLR